MGIPAASKAESRDSKWGRGEERGEYSQPPTPIFAKRNTPKKNPYTITNPKMTKSKCFLEYLYLVSNYLRPISSPSSPPDPRLPPRKTKTTKTYTRE